MSIDVHLLALHDMTPEDEARLTAVLDETELLRAGGFRFAHDRSAFIAAHGLARLALSDREPVPPPAWRFVRQEHGKPLALAPDGKARHFSLSHTRGLVAVAVADVPQIGVDVETVSPAIATDELAGAFCTEAEMRELAAMKESTRRVERFFALWTLKESLLKATGFGLIAPPRSIELRFDPLSITRLEKPLGGDWHLWSMPVGGTHLLGVAAAARGDERADLRCHRGRRLLECQTDERVSHLEDT
ncbi:4'-phosphopantetheinyl transferase family protein [Pseudochelatococcus sp. B33]